MGKEREQETPLQVPGVYMRVMAAEAPPGAHRSQH